MYIDVIFGKGIGERIAIGNLLLSYFGLTYEVCVGRMDSEEVYGVLLSPSVTSPLSGLGDPSMGCCDVSFMVAYLDPQNVIIFH